MHSLRCRKEQAHILRRFGRIPRVRGSAVGFAGRTTEERTLPVIGRTSLMRAFELSSAVAQSSMGDVRKTVLRAWRIDLAAASLSSPMSPSKATNRSLLQSWKVGQIISLERSRERCEGTHLENSRSVEKEVALEDFEDARKDVRASREKGDEERKKVEHLG